MKSRHKIIKNGRAHFEKFVDSQNVSNEGSLPLTHTTDAFDFRDIIVDQEIRPRYCSEFKHDLSYYFYGRPAYRKNGETDANSLAAYAPIVFIFSPNVLVDAAAAFPFDSGAFKGEKYSDLMHHRMSVEDFGLSVSHETIGKLVASFFGSNRNYYDQTASSKAKIGKNDFEAESYRELIAFRGKNVRDDRSTTIELIFDSALELRSHILAIVVPNSLLKDRKVKPQLKSLGVQILTYSDGANLNPASQIPRLCDVVRRFYIQKKILKR